jgi:hypothetical protein
MRQMTFVSCAELTMDLATSLCQGGQLVRSGQYLNSVARYDAEAAVIPGLGRDRGLWVFISR